MNTANHSFAPEQIMAWLDGELSAEQIRTISEHVAECAQCAGVADVFRRTSRRLTEWVIPNSDEHVDSAVREAMGECSTDPPKPVEIAWFKLFERRDWVIGGVGVAAGAVLLAAVFEFSAAHQRITADVSNQLSSDRALAVVDPSTASIAEKTSEGLAVKKQARSEAQNGTLRTFDDEGQTPATPPMIVRTAMLMIQIKDSGSARKALDLILARHDGYSASLTVDTPENGKRHFQASLRIPAAELVAALADLKTLGRTLHETQSGEEVTQQHADLVARLENSRETEERLRAILEQRTGKIEDVLHVEEEIARVRGEIEGMEAEQKALEHRVAFVGVDLELVEEYQEHFGSPPVSTTSRLHNAFIEGMRNASGTLIGLILFFEEFGPPSLIWLAILGVPIYFVWRRYLRVRAML